MKHLNIIFNYRTMNTAYRYLPIGYNFNKLNEIDIFNCSSNTRVPKLFKSYNYGLVTLFSRFNFIVLKTGLRWYS